MSASWTTRKRSVERPGPGLELPGLPFDRLHEAEVIENHGPELRREVPHRPEQPVDRLQDGARRRTKSFGLAGQSVPEPRNRHFQDRELLPELVVDLARDPGPLFLARRVDVAREVSKLLSRFLEFFFGDLPMRDVAVVRDQGPHLRVLEAIDSDDLDQPPRAVAMTASNLGDDRFSRTVERVREELSGAVEIVGMDELEDAASHELFEADNRTA